MTPLNHGPVDQDWLAQLDDDLTNEFLTKEGRMPRNEARFDPYEDWEDAYLEDVHKHDESLRTQYANKLYLPHQHNAVLDEEQEDG